MSISRQEEVIAVLWILAALAAFGTGHSTWGWIFAVKGGMDTAASIYFAIREAIEDKVPNEQN